MMKKITEIGLDDKGNSYCPKYFSNLELESSVLGILLSGEIHDPVLAFIQEEDFYSVSHRMVFRAINNIILAEGKCTVEVLIAYFRRHSSLSIIGGPCFLEKLINECDSKRNLEILVEEMKRLSFARQLLQSVINIIHNKEYGPALHEVIRAVEEVMDQPYLPMFAELEITSTITAAEVALSRIPDSLKNKCKKASELVKNWLKGLEKDFEQQNINPSMVTGLIDLDRTIEGLFPGKLYQLLGSDKTTFYLNIISNSVDNSRKHLPILIFSPGKATEQLITRLVAIAGQIDNVKLGTGRLKDNDWNKIIRGLQPLTSGSEIFIDDTPSICLENISLTARRIWRKYNGLSLIIIDDAELIKFKADSPITTHKTLKELAVMLKVPILISENTGAYSHSLEADTFTDKNFIDVLIEISTPLSGSRYSVFPHNHLISNLKVTWPRRGVSTEIHIVLRRTNGKIYPLAKQWENVTSH